MSLIREKFNLAIPLILEHEGGYVNDPVDPGGETNFGISKQTYPNVDIAALTVEDAKEIYFNDWWLQYRFGEIDDVLIATKLFDTCVHVGPKKGIRFAQQVLGIEQDGKIGNQTLAALNAVKDRELFLGSYRATQANYYRDRVAQNPKMKKYIKGWLRRAES